MPHRIPDPSARRRFVHRLTAIAAGVGAIGLGLVPEARAAAVAATSPTTTAIDNTLPTSYSLPSATQNALYSTALNDAGVALLLQSLPATGRLDAPVQSSDMLFASGARTQTVVMPVTSYADGSTLAYVFHGAATNTTVSGGPATPTLSAIVTRAGKVQIALGGQVVDHPTHEWAAVYQAMYFPAQYFGAAVTTTTTTTTSMATESLPEMLPRRARRLARWSPARMIKTMQAGGGGAGMPPAQQICINNCNTTAAACFAAAGAAAIAAALASLWCGVCIIMVIGASVAAGPGAPAVGLAGYTGCGWGCASAVAGMGATLALLDICRGNYQRCVAACTPPPPPPPAPQPQPQPQPNPDPDWPDNPFVPGPGNPIRPSAPVAA